MGALKVRTATDPNVWTTLGDGSPVVYASGAETVAGVEAAKAVTPAGLKAALPFIIIAPSGGDDTAAIQAAANALAPGGTLWFKPGIYQTTGTITFGKVNVNMPIDVGFSPNTSGFINYTGTGQAVVFDGTAFCDISISVKHNGIDWDDGGDTTSEGVVFRNCNNVRARVSAVQFNKGVVLRGDNAGASYNEFDLIRVDLNKSGLYFNSVGTGWTNQNTFTGQIRASSGATSYTGTRLIEMAQASNGNTFLGLTLEGSQQERTWVVSGTYNVFLNCRLEAVPVGSCEFTATSGRNMVIGGYNHLQPTQNIFADAGSANTFLSSGGISVIASGSTADGIIVHDEIGLTNAIAIKSINRTTSEITAGGKYVCYDLAGKEVDPTPIVEIDGISSTRGIRFGFPGSPGTANVGRIYCYNASAMGIIGNLYWGTNNTHDIGASGATPRDITTGRNMTCGGRVRIDGTAGTGWLEFFNEQTPDVAAPAANGCRVFTKDNGSGKTQLMARFATGAVVQLAIEP
jgi:hypothetical protein